MTQLTHDHAFDHPDFQPQAAARRRRRRPAAWSTTQGDLQVGDVFVLLSDGVHDVHAGQARCRSLALDERAGAERGAGAAALAAGSRDNATALVVRVLGVSSARCRTRTGCAQQLPIPPRLKVGDAIDGHTVTALVADNGMNILYQVRDPATPQAVRAQDPAPAARARSAGARHAGARGLAGQAHGVPAGRPRTWCAWSIRWCKRRARFYLLYDWHGGETLQQMLDRKHKFTLSQVVAAATQVARALGRLHRQGVIHRDVKPANLHQGEDGVLRLLDLGVALSAAASRRRTRAAARRHAQLHESRAMGLPRPGRRGPEEPPDAQSDLFALGVTLYQLLTGGKLPYGEVKPYQAGRYWRDPTAPSRRNPEVPIWLDHVVLKAVARDKRQRFETAEEMLLALERGASRPLTAPPATPLMQRDPDGPVEDRAGASACCSTRCWSTGCCSCRRLTGDRRSGGGRSVSRGRGAARRGRARPPFSAQVRVQRICMHAQHHQHRPGRSTAKPTKPQSRCRCTASTGPWRWA